MGANFESDKSSLPKMIVSWAAAQYQSGSPICPVLPFPVSSSPLSPHPLNLGNLVLFFGRQKQCFRNMTEKNTADDI